LPGMWKFVLPGAVFATDRSAPDLWLDVLSHFAGAKNIGLALRAEMPEADFAAARATIGSVMATSLDAPETIEEWAALAEVVFWCGYWNVESAGAAVAALPVENLLSIPLTTALDVGNALLSCMPGSPCAAAAFEALIQRFRFERNVLRIEKSDSLVRSDFIFSNPTHVAFGVPANEETSLQLSGLRALFPNADNYGCKGFGGIHFGRYDESEKTSVARHLLPPRWVVHYNRVARNLALATSRPRTWSEYVDFVFDIRRRVVAAMHDVETLLCEHFSAEDVLAYEKLAAVELNHSMIVTDVQLPLSAVDPWGFASEGDKSDDANKSEITADKMLIGRQAPWRYEQHVSKLEKYLMHAKSFIEDAVKALAHKSYTSKGPKKDRELTRRAFDAQALAKAREQIGLTLEHCVAMQRAVQVELGRFGNSEESLIFEKEELRTVRKVWELWLVLDLN